MSQNQGKSLEELRRVFSEMDARTAQAEQDLEALQLFVERFEAMEENRKPLEAYYFGDWREDVEAYEAMNPQEDFHSTSEDAIWNVTQYLHMEKIRLLKRLAESI
ncbi:hypothetical protein AAEX37_02270 [Oligella sp. MSHR50489EDL]|uniref:DUF4298 domain-containing protein n=1 Tax=Oligella sp. MSHR50489EDL TaxID=3139409 RepID=UPI003D819CD8